MHLLNTLGPVFIVILIGVALTRFRFLDAAAARLMNRCCYWIGLPCLLVLKIGTAELAGGAARDTTVTVLLATLALMAVAGIVGWLIRLKPRSLATFVHVGFRGNQAYVGLPVVYYGFLGTVYEGEAEAVASIALAVVVVLYNIVAVVIHLLSTHRFGWRAVGRVFLKLATNPILLACVAGLAWLHWGHSQDIAIPLIINRTMTILAQFALPLALLSVGATLGATPLAGMPRSAPVAAVLKTMIGPLLALGVARLTGVGPMETGVACILLGTPSAVVAYVLTEQLDGDGPLAAATIVISVVLSAATLPAVLAWIL